MLHPGPVLGLVWGCDWKLQGSKAVTGLSLMSLQFCHTGFRQDLDQIWLTNKTLFFLGPDFNQTKCIFMAYANAIQEISKNFIFWVSMIRLLVPKLGFSGILPRLISVNHVSSNHCKINATRGIARYACFFLRVENVTDGLTWALQEGGTKTWRTN